MKKLMGAGLILSMLFLAADTFGQSTEAIVTEAVEGKKKVKSYLDLLLNVTGTNLNYGDANSGLSDFKEMSNGLQGGVSFQAGITPYFSLLTELYFLRKGGKLKAGNPLTGSSSSIRLNSIELPVLARFHFGKFFVNAGPSLAYHVSGSRKIENMSAKLSFMHSGAGFKRFDAGVQMGGGVEFPIRQRRIALDLRYHYGLTDIAFDQEIYNRAVMVSVHFSKPWKTNPLNCNKNL